MERGLRWSRCKWQSVSFDLPGSGGSLFVGWQGQLDLQGGRGSLSAPAGEVTDKPTLAPEPTLADKPPVPPDNARFIDA